MDRHVCSSEQGRAPMDPLQPGDPRQVGPYRLTGRLGAGGMGQVFLGFSPGGRKVAVKVIRAEHASSPQFRARFAREVQAAQRVGGFHTAPVVDADPNAESPWLVTAFIPGPSLHQVVSEQGPLEPGAVRGLGAGLAEGLAAIHACGVVHRDLKPGNVIMAEDGPRIIDFGIARPADANSLTSTGVVIGTFAYMSPEQVRGERAEPASDVFSLACLLIFAATGQGPFDAPTIPAIVHRIINEEPRLDGITDDLRDLAGACLAKTPAYRPGVEEILTRLATRAIPTAPATKMQTTPPAGRPVTADRPTTTQPAQPPHHQPRSPALTATPTRPLADDGGTGPNDPTPPSSATPTRRWTKSRGAQLLAALSMTLVLAAAVAYFSADRNRNIASPQSSVSVTPAARYLRMPDFCGYVQNNEMRGRDELQPGRDEPGLDGTNDSRNANCGWGSADSVRWNKFRVIISAQLYGNVAAAKDAMAAIKPGRTTIDVTITTSKADDVGEEAMKSVANESLDKTHRYNDSWVHFRRNNVVVTVWYSESKVQLNDTHNKDMVTERALGWGRSLDGFLRDEPENHEKPIWG
ncbi:protein kinase [Nonomuraea sp. NPDC049695]|uniref:serine/threonine protein kinase n=1 Tax=Nonomuraea sp. NPDC049695 TaxID=3154734 RepID=UPI00341F20CC